MKNSFRLSAVISAPLERVYAAWLDSESHGAFSGGKASIQPRVGGKFTAWGGYISK
jgi:uncharacterized protein YndB with AHSA1/START domain